MTTRERNLAIVIGGAVGLYAIYQVGVAVLVTPLREADEALATLKEDYRKLRSKRDQLPQIASDWRAIVRRTYSHDPRVTQNAFRDELQQIATRHQLRGVSIQPMTGTRVGKSSLSTASARLTGEGTLQQVCAFLTDVYQLPALLSIPKLRLAPVRQLGGSDELKIGELVVEALITPPPGDAVDPIRDALRNVTTMPSDPAFIPASLRVGMPSEHDLNVLTTRNIFKAYEPPPQFAVTIDNQDRETVEITLRYGWKGEWTPQPASSIPGKSKRELLPGSGSSVEVRGRYLDGKTHGPQTFEYAPGKPIVFVVPAHTPPPPPTTFAYKVQNDGEEPVDLEVAILRGSTPKLWPLMKVPAKQTVDLPEMEGSRLTLTGIYADGTRAASGSYEVAAASTGVYRIPPKPTTAPVKPPPPPVTPANPDLQVTALLSYPTNAEMIALNGKTKKREVIPCGQPVDGGVLVNVHPAGGIVRMPGDAFYLYPLGRKFTDRVELDTREESGVAAAIERWNER